jgi:hypothetical protein
MKIDTEVYVLIVLLIFFLLLINFAIFVDFGVSFFTRLFLILTISVLVVGVITLLGIK